MHTRHKIYKLIDMYFMYVIVWALCHPKFFALTFALKHIKLQIYEPTKTSSFAFNKPVISSIIN